ncbi:MAG: sugar ABC transporter substrate-binding protein [Anaerolineae bacterium]|nr:sugar ABC transporter substrate-binding protein [Anaerolineae bacterium]
MKLRSVTKLLILSLCLIIMVTGAVGAQDAAPGGEVTFVFWDNTTETRAGWEAHVARFNEQFPDITVNLIGVPGGIWSDYLNGTATLIAGGEQPDIIWVATEGVRFLVDLGLMMPLNDLVDQDAEQLEPYFEDTAENLLNGFVIDEQLYFLPYSWNNMVIYYNRNMFDAAGIDYPSDDWTRDDFLAAAQAMTADNDNDGHNDQFGFSGSGGAMFFTLPWVFANDTDIVTDDFCAPNLTDPAVMDAIQFIYDMVYTYEIAPAPGTITNTEIQFINGEIAMFGAGRWATGGMYREGFEDYDIALWPGNPDNTTEFGVDGFGIFQSSQNVPAAWEFLKYMSSAEVQQGLVASVDSGSPLGNIPASRSVAEQLSQFPPDNYGAFYGSLDGSVRPVTAPPRFNELESIFIRYVDLVMANEMSVEDAMNAAQTELMSVVSC